MRRMLTLVLSLGVLGSVMVAGAPPADAFMEGASNNFFGTDAGNPGEPGTNNSFFGGSAGNVTTGSHNAFFGHDAGTSNTTGSENAFFGDQAGASNTTGCCNAFFGEDAGRSNSTGSQNAFFGRNAGHGNTTGFENSFFGHSAGFANSQGAFNAFFGRNAGAANTNGSINSFFGNSAGDSNTTGISNAFFGQASGSANTSGSDNVFLGSGAGSSNTTGSSNAFVGQSAGASNTTEDLNTYVGALSSGAAGITNATALGAGAQVTQSDSLVLGATGVRVGIGTTAPSDPLHVRRTDGMAKVLVQETSPTLEGRDLFELVNNGAARFRVRNTSNNATWDFQSSSNAGSFVIDRVGGDPSLDFELQPDGDLVVRGSVTGTSFITSSDRNLKTDITPANARTLMSLLRQLDISTWRFKNQPEGTVNLGPMAQDFHRLFAMGTSTTIDVRDLAALALVAAQVMDAENSDLRSELATQRSEFGDRLERLEASLAR